MSRNYYHYPVWVRLWHLTNAVICIFLAVTGIIMFAYDPLADSADRYQRSVSIHNVCGILLTISYLAFFFGNLFTANGKHYRIEVRNAGLKIWKQLVYYLWGNFRGEPEPFPVDGEHKFNPLQQMIYSAVMYIVVPLLFITGLVLMFPAFIIRLFPSFNGIEFNNSFHSILALLIVIFIVIHLTMSLTGRPPLKKLRSIISGWKESN